MDLKCPSDSIGPTGKLSGSALNDVHIPPSAGRTATGMVRSFSTEIVVAPSNTTRPRTRAPGRTGKVIAVSRPSSIVTTPSATHVGAVGNGVTFNRPAVPVLK